ncbi:antitoxin Xre/MbcA/ParS toxin-binding domain-containing protein [Deinococcus murrayi]|uniref:antitoxin Xre/MbcA/ParS toxin-binding domain-containing protein n=1 Tax=Deinococcus murrayi TaxID=68910 RepID=UPI00047F7CAE|nr:antitoxin Xre/MbcA/ParS toxin-binding domain-containing protein [Deinococcus murrayi]
MTRITATVDEQGRLTLPQDLARQLRAGQTIVIDLDLPPPATAPKPFAAFIGLLPPLDVDSATYYRRERGHEDQQMTPQTHPALDLVALSEKPDLTVEEVEQAACAVAGNADAAREFMRRPNWELGGKTPEEAVQQGEGQHVIGILAQVAGV